MILGLLLTSWAFAGDPIPGRNRVPVGATLCVVWTVDIDEVDELTLRGKQVDAVHVKGQRPRRSTIEQLVPLPRRELGLFARFRRGRGKVEVMQDPSRANGYRAIVRVTDTKPGWAKQVVEIFYAPRPAAPPPFPVSLPEVRATTRPHFWGEQAGRVRALAAKSPEAFRWEGPVEGYAVLAVGARGLELLPSPDARAKTGKTSWGNPRFDGRYLALSVCDGPGHARVIQRMNVAGERRVLIEIRAAGACRLVGHMVPAAGVDALYPPPTELKEAWASARAAEAQGRLADAAAHWIDGAVRSARREPRLWAIEQFCRTQPYPGPELSILEKLTVKKLAAQESVAPMRGKNIVFAWPEDYLRANPTRWRFLAETDAAMEWLKRWTGKDQVRARRKRMISRFRVDKGGVALYVDFRLHIPRKEMRYPPDHGPYSHEVSHGYIGFPALSPTGRYNEGLTEVSRVAYWWFLGLDAQWQPFERRCLETLKRHYDEGGDLAGVPGYAGAAGVYLALARRFCAREDGSIDWHRFAALFRAAGPQKGFDRLAEAAERAFGPDARALIKQLRLP